MPAVPPVAVGENVTPTLQVAPPAILAPHVLLAMAKFALAAMLEKLKGTLPRFVTVSVLTELVRPTVTVPKLKVLEENVTGALPVPLTVTFCGLVRASSVKVSVPDTAPVAAGENVTPTAQEALAARLAPQVLLAIANPALVAMPEMLRATFSRLVTLTVLTVLVFPTTTVPKLRLLDENVTGALPVPIRVTFCTPAFPAIVRVPEIEPTAVGANETRSVQEVPGATPALQLFVWLKGALVVTLATCIGPSPTLLRTTLLAELVVPTT